VIRECYEDDSDSLYEEVMRALLPWNLDLNKEGQRGTLLLPVAAGEGGASQKYSMTNDHKYDLGQVKTY